MGLCQPALGSILEQAIVSSMVCKTEWCDGSKEPSLPWIYPKGIEFGNSRQIERVKRNRNKKIGRKFRKRIKEREIALRKKNIDSSKIKSLALQGKIIERKGVWLFPYWNNA